ncbi:MAG: 50S ribosomal protein L15 [Bdellovibrionota bacterium]
MSILKELKPNDGSTHYRKRVGRGIGSGLGGYSGKGGKGQTQRSGGSIRRGFEGGQTPLHRRLPKFGFSNVDFADRYEIVNLDTLDKVNGDITPDSLVARGVVTGNLPIKLLGNGKVSKAFKVKVHKASEAAVKAITAQGGSVEIIERKNDRK